MNSLAHLDNPKPRQLGVTQLSRRSSSGEGSSRDVLEKLRTILEGIDVNVGNEETHVPHLEQQIRDWESAHNEALQSVKDLLNRSHNSFHGHLTAESVLFGTNF